MSISRGLGFGYGHSGVGKAPATSGSRSTRGRKLQGQQESPPPWGGPFVMVEHLFKMLKACPLRHRLRSSNMDQRGLYQMWTALSSPDSVKPGSSEIPLRPDL